MAPRSSRSSGSGQFHPPTSTSTFKDLLIFEERLKQNAERLQKQRRKYEAFLITLIAFILYLSHSVLILPSIYSLIHYGNVTLLLVSLVTLVLFFATGMYSEKIAYAYKFVPQANRALRPLNIYLNTRTRSRLSYLNIFRLTTSTPSPVTQTSTNPRSSSHTRANQAGSSHNGVPTFTNAPLRRTSSSSSHSSQSSIGSLRSAGAIRSQPPSRSPSPPASPVTRAPSSPTPANHIARGVPIPPIPPAQNPRGEIIFSSRVSGQFREGYERYRSEWERRRSEAASAAKARRGWWPIRWWKRRSPPILVTNDKAALDSGPLGSEKRGRRTSNAGGGSKNSSRQASPVRSAFPGSAAVMSTSSTTSTPTSSRAPSPEPDDSPAYGTKDGSRSSGRIRAASFSALLESMDEGEDGLGAMDEVHLVPSGVNG